VRTTAGRNDESTRICGVYILRLGPASYKVTTGRKRDT